jgi:uncharacterized cupin superfamily protein
LQSTVFDPHALDLQPYPVEPARLSEGTQIRYAVPWHGGDGSEVRGVWEMTPGVLRASEGDEMFVVLTGRATVQFQDGRTWQLSAGDVGITVPGDVADWTVHETLRKVFHRRLG